MQPCNADTVGATFRLWCGSFMLGKLAAVCTVGKVWGLPCAARCRSTTHHSEAWTFMRSMLLEAPPDTLAHSLPKTSRHQHCMLRTMTAACNEMLPATKQARLGSFPRHENPTFYRQATAQRHGAATHAQWPRRAVPAGLSALILSQVKLPGSPRLVLSAEHAQMCAACW